MPFHLHPFSPNTPPPLGTLPTDPLQPSLDAPLPTARRRRVVPGGNRLRNDTGAWVELSWNLLPFEARPREQGEQKSVETKGAG